MRCVTSCFHLKKVNARVGNLFVLYCEDKSTKFASLYEEVVYQCKLIGNNLFLVVLQNWTYEEVDYMFLLLNGGGVVLDGIMLLDVEGENLCFLEGFVLSGYELFFRKGQRDCVVIINAEGVVRYGYAEFKNRYLCQFLKFKKYLDIKFLN